MTLDHRKGTNHPAGGGGGGGGYINCRGWDEDCPDSPVQRQLNASQVHAVHAEDRLHPRKDLCLYREAGWRSIVPAVSLKALL